MKKRCVTLGRFSHRPNLSSYKPHVKIAVGDWSFGQKKNSPLALQDLMLDSRAARWRQQTRVEDTVHKVQVYPAVRTARRLKYELR